MCRRRVHRSWLVSVNCCDRKSESFALALNRKLVDPGLLAEGDLPVAVVLFEEARYVENFSVERLMFGAHDRGASEDPDFH